MEAVTALSRRTQLSFSLPHLCALIMETTMLNFKKTKTLKPIVISAFVTLSTVMTPTVSHAINDQVSIKVDASELTTQAGIERVYAKLELEAEKNCRMKGKVTLELKKFEKACKTKLMEDFIQSVDNKAMTAFHSAMKSSQ